jgi:hypothetical protein
VFDGHHNMTAALLYGAVGLLLAGSTAPQAQPTAKPKEDWCNATALELFKVPVVRVSGRIKEPRQLQHAAPKYPELPPGTVGSGLWIGDLLVGPDGRVHKISVLRDLTFKPPAPQFGEAIVAALKEWTYTPTVLDGRAVPICVTVSVNIHWR